MVLKAVVQLQKRKHMLLDKTQAMEETVYTCAFRKTNAKLENNQIQAAKNRTKYKSVASRREFCELNFVFGKIIRRVLYDDFESIAWIYCSLFEFY